VINASVTGETTAGGAYRIAGLLAQHRPSIVIVELGGNDGLRGLALDASRDNLDRMVRAASEAGAKVLIAGMRLPPNYGPAYTAQFESIFAEVAKRHGAALLPFLLEGFGERSDMFQPDRIHPAAEAQPLILDNVWRHLAPLLGTAPKRR
jgi:acyl-CoA thioesterase-1